MTQYRYLDKLRAIEQKKTCDTPPGLPPKLTKGTFGSPVSVPPGVSPEIFGRELTPDDRALQVLWRLAAQHRANLIAGGYDPAGARVALNRWREATALEPLAFHAVLRRLVDQGRVEHSDHYVRPMGGPT